MSYDVGLVLFRCRQVMPSLFSLGGSLWRVLGPRLVRGVLGLGWSWQIFYYVGTDRWFGNCFGVVLEQCWIGLVVLYDA